MQTNLAITANQLAKTAKQLPSNPLVTTSCNQPEHRYNRVTPYEPWQLNRINITNYLTTT